MKIKEVIFNTSHTQILRKYWLQNYSLIKSTIHHYPRQQASHSYKPRKLSGPHKPNYHRYTIPDRNIPTPDITGAKTKKKQPRPAPSTPVATFPAYRRALSLGLSPLMHQSLGRAGIQSACPFFHSRKFNQLSAPPE